jgi:hypothetical protein
MIEYDALRSSGKPLQISHAVVLEKSKDKSGARLRASTKQMIKASI